MVEAGADLLLALKALEAGDVALQRHERHLDRDGLAGLPVVRLEDRGHVAAGDQVGQLEALVQQPSRRKLARAGATATGLAAGFACSGLRARRRVHHPFPVTHFE